MRLNCFVDWLDVGKGEQFAALTIETGDGRLYLSFRGTDDTLAGWREDFELACMPEVPAQKKALQYVEEVARQFPRKKLRLGGHSKGGNLAVYAGVFCPAAVQRRIAAVWSNDGPGFHTDLLDLPPPYCGAHLFYCAQVLCGRNAAGARRGLHGGRQRSVGFFAA